MKSRDLPKRKTRQNASSALDGAETDFRIMMLIVVLLVLFSIAGYYADHWFSH
jgi:hypothetical protein